MADILIRGMEMPTHCDDCTFYDGIFCARTGYYIHYPEEKLEECPLIEVPDHGRLIDADALHKLFEDQWHYLQVLDWNENPTAEATQSGINWCINTMHDDAPTIIPANPPKEET